MAHEFEHECGDPATCPVHADAFRETEERYRDLVERQEIEADNARLQADSRLLETCCGHCLVRCRLDDELGRPWGPPA